MTTVVLNGHTYSDDSDPATGLGNGGHRTRFIPALADAVVELESKRAAAAGSELAAETAQDIAEAAALTAVNAPGTSATSASNLTVGTGAQSLVIQAGKSLVAGMALQIASTASPTNWMHGIITAYNAGTGALDVAVTYVSGAGTFAAWTVSLSAPVRPIFHPWMIKTAAYAAVAGDRIQADTSAVGFPITLPANPAANDRVSIADYAGTWGMNSLIILRNGSPIMGQLEDRRVSTPNISINLEYIDATQGWRLVK